MIDWIREFWSSTGTNRSTSGFPGSFKNYETYPPYIPIYENGAIVSRHIKQGRHERGLLAIDGVPPGAASTHIPFISHTAGIFPLCVQNFTWKKLWQKEWWMWEWTGKILAQGWCSAMHLWTNVGCFFSNVLGVQGTGLSTELWLFGRATPILGVWWMWMGTSWRIHA